MENYFQQKQHKPRLSKRQSSQNNEYYYSQYQKVYELSLTLTHNLLIANQKQQQFIDKIKMFSNKIQDLRDPMRREVNEKKRKVRRSADQINKEFTCEAQNCQKEYATLASLKIHQKLKHPQMDLSDKRQKSKEEGNND